MYIHSINRYAINNIRNVVTTDYYEPHLNDSTCYICEAININ